MYTTGVKLTADVANFTREIGGRAVGAVKTLNGELDKSARAGKLDHVADQAARFGLVGAAAFGLIAKANADFDKQMSAVRAATHANAAEMDRLRQAALQAGKDTQFSATQAAQGIEELSKAGVKTSDILGGGLKGALDLAAAGQLGVGEAAETAASAMTQFRLQGNKVPHVADLLAAGAGKAQGSVHDMGMALSQSGLVASQMGLSIEDATGTLAAFANAGLVGSDAGTSFKQMLLMLQNPAEKTQKLMDQLGISAYDASGQFVGIANLAGQLQAKLGGLTQAQRDAALAQIFGSDAIRSANVLFREGSAGIQGWIDKVNVQGYAAETAAIKTDNLAGDIERLKGSLETMSIEAGSGANGGLRVLTKSANALVDQIGKLPPGITASATVLVGLGGVLLLGGAAWIKYRKTVAEAHEQLVKTGPMGERASAGLQATTKWAGRAAAAFTALQIAGAAVDAAMGDLNPQFDALAMGLQQFATGGVVTGEAARLLGGDMGKLDTALKDVADTGRWSSFARGFAGTLESVIPGISHFDDSLTNSRERLKAVDQALAQMVQSGSAAQAAAAFDAIAKRAQEQGVSVAELRKALPGYAAAVETAGTASTTAASGVTAVGNAAEDAKKKADDAAEAFKNLFGIFMDSDKAEIHYRETLASTNKELREGKRTLDLKSEAGRTNRKAVLDLIGAINDERTANINNGTSVKDADKRYRDQIGTLINTMLHLGYTRADVIKLIGKYKDIPQSISTDIKTPGLPAADRGVKDYDKKLDGLARQIRTEVNVIGVSGAYAQLKSLLIQQQALKKGIPISAARAAYNKNAYASGGYTGPGSKYQEAGTVHAGEYVFNAEATSRIGVGTLERMHKAAQVPGYAAGGYVLNAPFPVNARMTRIPSLNEALSVVGPPSGQTYKWMERVVRSAFPGMAILSDFRPGARTLSGNVSYHALGRAVDFPPSLPLAEWINYRYGSRTKELITPWNSLNLLNGRRHTYTGAVFRQHNFAGGNAHDHWAMARGGLLDEPVFGVGASGRTYSFAERGPEWVVPHYATVGGDGYGGGGGTTVVNQTVNVTVPGTNATAQQIAQAVSRELGRQADIYARGAA